MKIETLSEFVASDVIVRYTKTSSSSEQVGLTIFPARRRETLSFKRQTLAVLPYIHTEHGQAAPNASVVEPLAHLKLIGDEYAGGFSQGTTLRASATNNRFRYRNQIVEHAGSNTCVRTVLASDPGLELHHCLTFNPHSPVIEIFTELMNRSNVPVRLELLTSFVLGGITPFHPADAPDRLTVHRFRSGWSAEGRLESRSIEEMHLERSWSGAGLFVERFGQVGSMPVRRYFPFLAVSDSVANVTWGAQLAWTGSWQLEISRQHDDLCLSGGLADREFGHWVKTLAPGESLVTPTASLTCVEGGVEQLCQSFTRRLSVLADAHPQVEQDLPIIFNEYCTTWGDPSHDKLIALADRLRGSPIRYFVIDAGWYKGETANWDNSHGDWVPNPRLFPKGLRATADALRERGFIPGLWFEFETVGFQSRAWHQTDLLLKRDGVSISVRGRRFWNLADHRVVELLSERVVETLRNGGFGYLKVDCNETLGIGTDHAESLGEGLRLHTHALHHFFNRIRTELPDLVIENCSSGGHRLEPAMLAATSMSSFSDAHELPEIPIIAANLHNLVPPRQSQIWAVLSPDHNDHQLGYVLASTFLGRMCISGKIDQLSTAQWSRVQDYLALYQLAAPILRDGTSRLIRNIGPSWRYPSGWQALIRTSDSNRLSLVVVHAFAQAPANLHVPLPTGTWSIKSCLGTLKVHGGSGGQGTNSLVLDTPCDFCAAVIVLDKN